MDARESKGTPAKAWVSKGNPEQEPESFARSLCSLASLAPRNNNTQKNQAQQATTTAMITATITTTATDTATTTAPGTEKTTRAAKMQQEAAQSNTNVAKFS